MSETRTLLAKISALRQRLEQAQGLANEARSAAAALLNLHNASLLPSAAGPEQTLLAVDEEARALDQAVRPLTASVDGEERQPRQLSSRARRVLERGRDLLGQLRTLTDSMAVSGSSDDGPPPLLYLYRDTVAMIDTALRTVALMPDSVSTQMQLCRGLEVTIEEVSDRLNTLTAGCQRQERSDSQMALLSTLLQEAHRGTADSTLFLQLAEELLQEDQDGEPLEWMEASLDDVSRFIAAHSLNTARVMARVVRQDPELRGRARDLLVTALLHDVGMLSVPVEVLANEDLLEPEQRRLVEGHCLISARRIAALFPDAPWLADAAMAHHERRDGTGYPDGLKGNRIQAPARLLAVCDVYAALCCPRPHRPARATRTAMADTLVLADQEQLDRHFAECLLSLSFYPVGSVVEMAQGGVGVVVATQANTTDLSAPARPVVALLTDSDGKALPRPRHVDLSKTEGQSIVRPLGARERRELLATKLPRWAA